MDCETRSSHPLPNMSTHISIYINATAIRPFHFIYVVSYPEMSVSTPESLYAGTPFAYAVPQTGAEKQIESKILSKSGAKSIVRYRVFVVFRSCSLPSLAVITITNVANI
jgi:hypothetical protein